VFTVGALAFAFATWLPIARELARAAWASGAVGRIAAVLILALVAGPLAQLGLGAARRVGATVAGVAANLRFRLQSSWRVAAAESLAALPTVGDMDDDTLSDLAGRVGRRRIRRRTTVVRQGEPANEFFVVRRGIFEIVERDQSGGDRLLRRVGPGESFGELALLEGRVRTASVRASTDGELFVFDAGTFKRLLAPAMSRPALAPALGPALEVQALAPFRGLSLEDAALIAAQAEHFDVPAGSDVVRGGDVADGFFVLRAGQAIVEREGVRVATLRAGDHFGELALLHDSRRQATVRTVTPASVLRIDDDLFHRLVAGAMTRQSDHVAGRELGGEFT
jgi:CRP-like cAMP-binding protein